MELTDVIFSSVHPFRGGFSVDFLQDCLIERRDRNAPIKKLALADCFFLFEEDVENLEEIVPEVDWDGYEQEYESEEENEEDSEDSYVYQDAYYGHEYYDWAT